MFEILPESKVRRIYVKADGRLTDADYKELVPRLDAAIRDHGPIRLLVDMAEFEGWSPRAAWDDLLFGLKHWNDFERMALIGDKRWEDIAAKAMDALTKGEVRRFPAAERGAAHAWIEDACPEFRVSRRPWPCRRRRLARRTRRRPPARDFPPSPVPPCRRPDFARARRRLPWRL